MPKRSRIFKRPLFKDIASFSQFLVSVIFIIGFFYMNLYTLPLGVTTVQSAIDLAGELGGIEVEIYGEITASGEADFNLSDVSTNGTIFAICAEDTPIPSEGSVVIATGKIFYDGSQTIMMCEFIDPVAENTVAFKNPWSLPVIRTFAASIIWFIAMAAVTGILAVVNTERCNLRIENRTVAFSEMVILSGVISIALILFLSSSEGNAISSLSTLSIPIIISVLFVTLFLLLRSNISSDVSELSHSLPFIALMAIIIGLPLSMLQLDVIYYDYLSEAITENILASPISIILGATGFIVFAIYLSSRRYKILSVGALVERMRSEVRRH